MQGRGVGGKAQMGETSSRDCSLTGEGVIPESKHGPTRKGVRPGRLVT